MQLPTPSKSLYFAIIVVLGLLTTSRQESLLVLVILDHYGKLTLAVPTARVTALLVATIFLKNWIVPFEFVNTALAGNGLQFVSSPFAPLCTLLKTIPVTRTEYNLYSTGQVERCNKTLEARLCHYIDEQ